MAAPSLSREVLKWLQSLDLAYSVKNAKRDFANGFLVAEIFSRYFPKDIEMHSYDNASSVAAKRDNWELLLKFFARHGIEPGGKPVSRVTAEEIIRAKPQTIIRFINEIYELLTGRKAPSAPRKPSADTFVPSYAKDTASRAVLNKLREATLETTEDKRQRERHVRATLTRHERSRLRERERDPLRFDTTRGRSKSATRNSNSGIRSRPSASAGIGSGTISRHGRTIVGNQPYTATGMRSEKGSDVTLGRPRLAPTNAIEDTMGRLQSNGSNRSDGLRTLQASQTQGEYFESSMSTQTTEIEQLDTNSKQSTTSKIRPNTSSSCIEQVNTCVHESLLEAGIDPNILKRKDQEQSLLMSLLDSLRIPDTIPDEAAAQVLHKIGTITSEIATACTSHPSDFIYLVSFLNQLLSGLSPHTLTFEAATQTYRALGVAMVHVDETVTAHLFAEFSLPAFLRMLRERANSRFAVLPIIYSFARNTPDARIMVLRSLQERLQDVPLFIRCLSVLAHHDTAELDEQLLDLYTYYGIIGIGSSNHSLRASALSMLVRVASQNIQPLLHNWDDILALADDTWWETLAQLVVLCVSALQQHFTAISQTNNQMETQTEQTMIPLNDDIISNTIQTLEKLMRRPVTQPVTRMIFSYCGQLLHDLPSLSEIYLEVLFRLPYAQLTASLNLPYTWPSETSEEQNDEYMDELPFIGSSGLKYKLPTPSSFWATDALATAFTDYVQTQKLQQLDISQLAILYSLLTSDIKSNQSVVSETVVETVKTLSALVLVGLCNEDTCLASVRILKLVFQATDTEFVKSIIASSTLEAAIVLLLRPRNNEENKSDHVNNVDGPVQHVYKLLEQVADENESYRVEIANMLSRVKDRAKDVMDGTGFDQLLH